MRVCHRPYVVFNGICVKRHGQDILVCIFITAGIIETAVFFTRIGIVINVTRRRNMEEDMTEERYLWRLGMDRRLFLHGY